jgi:cytosine/adenosine deaminase-related metal-dependent hydrolase
VGRDELRAKLAALEETRETAERELDALRRRTERLEGLERDRDGLIEPTPRSCPGPSTRSARKGAIGCIK